MSRPTLDALKLQVHGRLSYGAASASAADVAPLGKIARCHCGGVAEWISGRIPATDRRNALRRWERAGWKVTSVTTEQARKELEHGCTCGKRPGAQGGRDG